LHNFVACLRIISVERDKRKSLRKENEKREEIFRDEMPIYSLFMVKSGKRQKKRRVVKEVVKVCHEIKESGAF
jgi:hypothetical protein